MTNSTGVKIISQNRKARHRFFIMESFEAGLVLLGHEVKSLRSGKISLDEGLVRFDKGELFLFNVHIPPYEHLSHVEYEPTRTRKLLMHRKEIEKISSQAQVKGLALFPLEIYFKNGIVKVSVGMGKGKKDEDQREEIKKRDVDRDIHRRIA